MINYDEQGRAYYEVEHWINTATGVEDDNLERGGHIPTIERRYIKEEPTWRKTPIRKIRSVVSNLFPNLRR